MNDMQKNALNGMGRDVISELPREIAGLCIKKGLTYRQAEALLELTKDLLKDAVMTF